MQFSQMIESKSDAELGAVMRDRYTRLMDAASMGLCDHPVHAYNADNAILRQHRVSKDAAGSGLGSRELEETDQPRAQDDDDPMAGANPSSPGGSRAGGTTTMDSTIPGYDRILSWNRDKRVVDEDLIVQSPRSW
jgi:hypothetical protein